MTFASTFVRFWVVLGEGGGGARGGYVGDIFGETNGDPVGGSGFCCWVVIFSTLGVSGADLDCPGLPKLAPKSTPWSILEPSWGSKTVQSMDFNVLTNRTKRSRFFCMSPHQQNMDLKLLTNRTRRSRIAVEFRSHPSRDFQETFKRLSRDFRDF